MPSSAIGLRDQRVRVYERTDQGTDGFPRPVFRLLYTRWGRLDDTAAATRIAQQKLQLQIDAVCEFSSETEVPPNGILKDGDGIPWAVRGIYGVRQLRRTVVGLERIAEEKYRTFEVYEGNSTLDGVHMVDPAP